MSELSRAAMRRQMPRSARALAAALLSAFWWNASGAADAPGGVALPGTGDDVVGQLLLQLRPRFTYVTQTNKPETARAENMRLLLGYRTAPNDELRLTGEVVNVGWLEPKRASILPGNFASPYPLVADPDKSDLNLLHAEYLGVPGLRVTLGRQSIRLDNERFVGAADARQMPQVFDAISARYTGASDAQFFVARAWHVRTFFGNRIQTATTLLNGRIDTPLGLTLGAYGYFQNQSEINQATGLADNANRIIGVRVEGDSLCLGGARWYYTAEAAQQRPYAGGDAQIRASYLRLAAGPRWERFSAQLNYERLGSNSGRYGFQMPLSYNTFQGWAYSFFSTPAEGIRDLNIAFQANLGAADVTLKRHRFRADFGGSELGSEWDLMFGYRLSHKWSIRAVSGRFVAASGSRRPTGALAAFGQRPAPSATRATLTLQYDY